MNSLRQGYQKLAITLQLGAKRNMLAIKRSNLQKQVAICLEKTVDDTAEEKLVLEVK